MSNLRCVHCGDAPDPNNPGLGVQDQGHWGGMGMCGDLHDFRPQYDVVVTRHQGLVDLARQRGWVSEDTPVLSHVTPEDVRDRHVFGVLPLSLAAYAASVTEVPLSLPPEWRGWDLTAEETAQVAGNPRHYKVKEV